MYLLRRYMIEGAIIVAGMRRKVLICTAALAAFAIATVKIEYHSLGWGGYWSVDFVAPWERWR